MPTPRVSVPQMTLSRPACASFSTRRRYFGSIPAWCTPIPCLTRRDTTLPKPALNRKSPIRPGDRVLLLAAADLEAGQRLGLLDGGRAAGVDDVDRRVVGLEQLLDRLVQRRRDVAVQQRDRTFHRGDRRGRAARAPGQLGLETADVAEGGRHQQELRVRQLDQRDLPGPAAVDVAVVVELVHDHAGRRRRRRPGAGRGWRGSRRCSR